MDSLKLKFQRDCTLICFIILILFSCTQNNEDKNNNLDFQNQLKEYIKISKNNNGTIMNGLYLKKSDYLNYYSPSALEFIAQDNLMILSLVKEINEADIIKTYLVYNDKAVNMDIYISAEDFDDISKYSDANVTIGKDTLVYDCVSGKIIKADGSQYEKPIVEVDMYRYKIDISDNNFYVWTDLPSEKIMKDDSVPENIGNDIKLYIAQNEYEPIQIALKSKLDTSINISIENNNSGINVEMYQVKYIYLENATDSLGKTGYYPDPLYPIENNQNIILKYDENTPFWFIVNTDKNLKAGNYEINIVINNTIKIPVKINVFNFAIPENLNVKSQMNFSHQAVLEKYGVSGTGEEYWKYVDKMKEFFIKHRLTPKSVLWSGGLTSNGGKPYINYDYVNREFYDPHGIWGFEIPADKYLNGNGFNNGTGFPSFMAITFQNNDPSIDQRPLEFAGESRTELDWYTYNNPNTNYNKKWFNYMQDIEKYLKDLAYLDKAYYYMANEPQNEADYDATAWYSQELKKAAPNLKLMVSEEPKPEIYNNLKYSGAKIDIWLSVLNNYNNEISWEREKNHNEETWIYFLHGTRPPYFNPITIDHNGIESKLIGWFLWKYRIKGIAYYAMNDWSKNPWTEPMNDNHNGDLFMLYPPSENNVPINYGATNHRLTSSIRFELMRDSLEDYEYLYKLNNSQNPIVYDKNIADDEADKIIYGLTSYNRDSKFMYTLRKYIGMKISGEIADIPIIEDNNGHPRTKGEPGNYYINFQDPLGNPLDNPLIFEGNEYIKIGWNVYSEELGYGWYGSMDNIMYRYIDNAPNVLQGSIMYDDWGREKTFEFDLPNGVYNVTVSCGWQGRNYKRNKITVEGIKFIDDEATNPYIVRTKEIEINDNKLTMEMGIFDEYIMLNYMKIEAK